MTTKPAETVGKKCQRSTVRRAWLYNQVFRCSSGYTYRMSPRIVGTMSVIFKDLYGEDDHETLGREFSKYWKYYDTNIPFDGLITSLVINMEEKRVGNPDLIPADTIAALQTGLMGPVASIGDVFIQAICVPLLLSIGIALCGTPEDPNIIGPLFSLISIACLIPGVSYTLWMKTYDIGESLIDRILDGGLTGLLLKGSNIVGCIVMGAMIPKYVTVTTSIAWINPEVGSNFILQTQFFDRLMPSLIPLLLTLFFLQILKKGTSVQLLTYLVMIASIVLSFLGILGNVPTV